MCLHINSRPQNSNNEQFLTMDHFMARALTCIRVKTAVEVEAAGSELGSFHLSQLLGVNVL